MTYHLSDYSNLDSTQMDSFSNPHPLTNFSVDKQALGQEYSLLQSILVDGGTHYGVSTVEFDTLEELLWMGNQGGHVTSYSSPDLQKYTSFQIHASNEVRKIVPHEQGILSLTSNSLRMSSRRGLTTYTHSSEQMQDMQCMVLTPSGTLLLGGHHKNLIEFDLNVLEEIKIIQVQGDNCAILRNHPRFICSGDISGKVTLHDPNTLSVEHMIDSHSGMLSDFDVHGNHLVTCGFSQRHGELTVDRLLKVYDLRVMRSMAPIQLMFPPLLLHFIPAYSSRLCVVSQTGQFQMIDTDNTEQYSFIHQVDAGGANILTFDTSSSCQALAFGDAQGYLHLYGASNQVQFNQFSRPTEFADSVEQVHSIDINDELTPLSIVPIPHCQGKLLSDWPSELSQNVYRPTPPIDPGILESMRMVGSIGYAPNPGNKLRNQVPYPLNQNRFKKFQDSSAQKDNNGDMIPERYLKHEMKYTRNVDDLDYSRYNRTCFAGLEANLPNSYCNDMLQVLYFIEPLRAALISHICQREFCLACELGFLFHMLDTSRDVPCLASNFLRAFRTIPEASAHGLVVSDLYDVKKRGKLQNLVQNWTRFILQQLHTETLEVPDNGSTVQKPIETESDSILNRLFGSNMFSTNCCRCKTETCQETTTLTVRLLYPESKDKDKPPEQLSFAKLVQRSLSPRQQISAYCETCKKFTSMIQTKFPKTLPDILVLSCGDNKQDVTFWKTQLKLLTESGKSSMLKALPDVPFSSKKHCRYGISCTRIDCRYYHEHRSSSNANAFNNSASWIPFGLKLTLKGTEIVADNWPQSCENKEKATSEQTGNGTEEEAKSVVYELMALVSVIVDNSDNGKDNIVSCIKVGSSYHERRKGGGFPTWYLFNDFTVVPITAEEAVFLNMDWKWPSILFFSRIDLNTAHCLKAYNPIDEQVFQEDISLATCSGQSRITFTPLSNEDCLSVGRLVAMDAEFVTLNQEEAEIRSDGTRSTIKPSHKSLARISCVRGDGPLEGVPFIDDYISTQEQVVDYLTKFSGILPGDLDASISSKHLTTLKATYIKLRYLVDSGVVFVGHGLKNDFRVINLIVPPAQIIDTVYLFQLPNKRMISLQFLAWHFLDLKIQAETHDSIEDAKTALQLYKKYEELKLKGKFNESLTVLYEVGRNLQWKIPGIDDNID